METTTENTLAKPSIKYKVVITADSTQLDEALQFCKDKWGHRSGNSGWSWRVQSTFKAKKFVFSFINEEDALLFKLSKG